MPESALAERPRSRSSARQRAEASKALRWWNSLADWQKAAVVVGGTVAVVATGGAAAWAISTVGGAVVVEAGGATITLAVGGVATSLLGRGQS